MMQKSNELLLRNDEVITLQVVCNSKDQSIERLQDGSYKIKIKSIAQKGKANKELIDFMKDLGYKIEIVRGDKSHRKIIKIVGLLR